MIKTMAKKTKRTISQATRMKLSRAMVDAHARRIKAKSLSAAVSPPPPEDVRKKLHDRIAFHETQLHELEQAIAMLDRLEV